MRVSRFAREGKYTNSTLTSSGQDQRLREEFDVHHKGDPADFQGSMA
jgi:hypothetical protein